MLVCLSLSLRNRSTCTDHRWAVAATSRTRHVPAQLILHKSGIFFVGDYYGLGIRATDVHCRHEMRSLEQKIWADERGDGPRTTLPQATQVTVAAIAVKRGEESDRKTTGS